jgi:DNA-binding beta-propeller fold protein YncE
MLRAAASAAAALACTSCFFFHGEEPAGTPVGTDSFAPIGVTPEGNTVSAPQYAHPTHPTPSPALLVLTKKDEMLSIVDPGTLQIVARVPVGRDPHEVVASADGRFAYVSNYGHGAYDTIAVVDLEAQHAMPAIDLGPMRGPHGLRYVDDHVWFTAEGAKAVGSYDPQKHVVDWILGTGQDRTHMLFVTDDTNHIITTNVSSGTMSFLDRQQVEPTASLAKRKAVTTPGGDWHEQVVNVGQSTEGFDVAPDGAEVWAADADDGSIAVVDLTTRKLAQRMAAEVTGANRLKFTPDGKWVIVSSLRNGNLAVFDAHRHAELKRIPLGRGAAGLLVTPDGARVFASCSPDGYVAVIDTSSWTLSGKIQVGTEPDGLAWAVRP